VAEHPPGIDLEAIASRDAGLERFLMAPEQRGMIDDWPHGRDEALVLVWTLKEAVLKARRSGFRTSPKKLRLSIHPVGERDEEIGVQNENAHPASGQARISVENGQEWTVSYTSVPTDRANYWFAVAIPG
jgi:4'-phosphopantetheinyl transferase